MTRELFLKDFERALDLVVDEYLNLVPIDDLATIMCEINAEPCTAGYLQRLKQECSNYCDVHNLRG